MFVTLRFVSCCMHTLKFDHPVCTMPIRLRSHTHSAIHSFNHYKIIRFAEKCSFCLCFEHAQDVWPQNHHTYRIVCCITFAAFIADFYRSATETKCYALEIRQNDILMISNLRHGRRIVHFIWTLSLTIFCTPNPILHDFKFFFLRKWENFVAFRHLRDHQCAISFRTLECIQTKQRANKTRLISFACNWIREVHWIKGIVVNVIMQL